MKFVNTKINLRGKNLLYNVMVNNITLNKYNFIDIILNAFKN